MEFIELIKDSIAKKKAFDEKCQIVVDKLRNYFPHYNWVGIYMLEGNTLKLSNYCGDFDTEHKVIPIDKGICGKAIREKSTVIVPNVNESPEYIVCSIKTKSEIVVPIGDEKNLIGEIDIDSYQTNAFSYTDKIFLEEIAHLLFEEYKKEKYTTSNNVTRIRVSYKDTDKMGVVHHANFVEYFEVARTESFRNCGISYKEIEDMGIILVVGEVYIKILKSAFYDELLTVKTHLLELSKVRLKFEYEIFNEKKDLIVTGYTTLFPLDANTKRIKRLNDFIIAKLQCLTNLWGGKNG